MLKRSKNKSKRDYLSGIISFKKEFMRCKLVQIKVHKWFHVEEIIWLKMIEESGFEIFKIKS